MLVLPAIDLKDGRCVRLAQGRASELTVYDANPIEVARRVEAAGAPTLPVLDLDGAFTGESRNREIAKRIVATVNVPVQIGGGLRSHEDVCELIDAGVARVDRKSVV